ncbi:hypothetical protein GX48_03576 [Paracoccidioides brasiliensis]|nr:hypothetical protein GX48_03576 [Paracoccidioides brasiliensis]
MYQHIWFQGKVIGQIPRLATPHNPSFVPATPSPTFEIQVTMELNNIKPSEIVFNGKLFASDYSVIFLVMVHDQVCVMKVHHGRGPRWYYEPKDRELDISMCLSLPPIGD